MDNEKITPLWKSRGMAPCTLQQIFSSISGTGCIHVYFGESSLAGVSLPAAAARMWRLDGDVESLFTESGQMAVRVAAGTLRAEEPADLSRFEKAMLTLYK